MPGIDEGLCSCHFLTAPARTRSRFAMTARRLSRLQGLWENEAQFEVIVQIGRYLKLADTTHAALDATAAAWHQLKLSLSGSTEMAGPARSATHR